MSKEKREELELIDREENPDLIGLRHGLRKVIVLLEHELMLVG